MSNVLISVVSEFDKKGFSNAEKATSSLDKSMKKLGKTVLGVFSAQKIISYSKASVRAFADDQKAAALLSNQLKNLGLAYAAVDVEKFIGQLQAQTGILDDELRPAFSQLARVTGSVAESQKLMSVAFDASRGAGIGFLETVKTLSQAYVGNKKGLRQLNLGLTQAELTAMSFDEILAKITTQFKGAGAAALSTYAGKLDLLKVAGEDAKETIGEGFVDAFSLIADDQDFNDVLSAIDGAALAVADMIRGVGVALNKIDSATPSWLKKLIELNFNTGWIGLLRELGANERRQNAIGTGGSYFTKQANDKLAAAAEKKRQADALKAEQARLAILKKQTTEKRAQALLEKANATLVKAKAQFDLEGIQIAAALQNKSLTADEKNRLLILQQIWELEQAIAANDLSMIELLMKQLELWLKKKREAEELLAATTELKGIFDLLGFNKQLIDTLNLEQALSLLQQMAQVTFATVSGGTRLAGTNFGGTNVYDVLAYGRQNELVNPDMPIYYEGYSGASGTDPNTAANIAAHDIYVTAIVEGNVMTQNDLATAIREQIQEAQQSGKDVNWARQALPATFL